MIDTTVIERKRRLTAAIVLLWLFRIVVALLFLYIGFDKLSGRRVWVRMFDTIGIGQWFRYLTGTLQMAGAALVLAPRTFLIGIAVLACTMAGACVAWLTVLNSPVNVIIPGTLLVFLLAVGVFGWRSSPGL